MKKLKTKPPITVPYRGNLQDTALLVGLSHMTVNVGLIFYTGDLSPPAMAHLEAVNKWLRGTSLPQISVDRRLKAKEVERLLVCPLKGWGWEDSECQAAIQLAGIPLPP